MISGIYGGQRFVEGLCDPYMDHHPQTMVFNSLKKNMD